jgi:hypothetical protein
VMALLAALLTRRAAHDDVHSVEGYHRSLHTLESINAHPATGGGSAKSAEVAVPYPESAVRVARSGRVGLREEVRTPVPPVAAPPIGDAELPLKFDDAGPSAATPPGPFSGSPSGPPLATLPAATLPPGAGHRDKAMTSINHRPRRLAAPAMAVAAVLVLIVVLLLTGAHSVPPHHPRTSTTHRDRAGSPTSVPRRTTTSTSTPSAPAAPAVSLPQAATAHSATYDVGAGAFTVTVAATSGSCWVDATSTTTGTTLFAGTLAPGGRQSFGALGPVTMLVGAPTVFVASVDGVAAVLPAGFQTPFTMSFVTT